MKKFLFFASYVFALFMICSCTNEEVLTSMETANETTYKTLTELEAYNKVMLGKVITRGSDNKSKGNVTTDDVADAINVVKADAEGAAVGLWLGKGVAVGAGAVTGGMGALVTEAFFGSVFGAAASYKAVKDNKAATGNPNVQNKNPDPSKKGISTNPISMDTTFLQISEKVYMDNIGACEQNVYVYNAVSEKIQIPERFGYLKRVGEEHNALVSAVLEVEKSDSQDLSLEDFKGAIPSVDVTPAQLDALFNDYRFKNAYAKLLHDVGLCTDENGFDVDKFLNLNINMPYSVRQALHSYSVLLDSYPKNLDDVVEITNGYINIIENYDEFNNNEREMIYSALIVSLYSPQLWGVFDEE